MISNNPLVGYLPSKPVSQILSADKRLQSATNSLSIPAQVSFVQPPVCKEHLCNWYSVWPADPVWMQSSPADDPRHVRAFDLSCLDNPALLWNSQQLTSVSGNNNTGIYNYRIVNMLYRDLL